MCLYYDQTFMLITIVCIRLHHFLSFEGDKRMLVCQLTPNDVADYLRSLKLDQYVETFLENDVDGEMMNEIINESTLEALDVQKKDRLKIKFKFKSWAEKRVANISI